MDNSFWESSLWVMVKMDWTGTTLTNPTLDALDFYNLAFDANVDSVHFSSKEEFDSDHLDGHVS